MNLKVDVHFSNCVYCYFHVKAINGGKGGIACNRSERIFDRHLQEHLIG